MDALNKMRVFDPLRGHKAVDPMYRIYVKLVQKVRLLTGRECSLPDFLVIGAMKAGTSSLLHYLFQHPQILPSIRKEVHYFDIHYDKSELWYRSHFPPRSRLKNGRLTGEATPIYLFDPRVPERIKELCPDAKLIVILRNPTDRAISHYYFLKKKKLVDRSIEEYLAREDDRYRTAIEEGEFQGFAFRHALKERGLYADQIRRYLAFFPRERIHFLFSENLSKNPRAELKRIFSFLEIDESFEPKDLEHRNVAPFPKTVAKDVRSQLDRFFEPHKETLEELLGEDLPW